MIFNYNWEVYAPIIERLNYLIISNKFKKIVEIGPGTRPFNLATEFVDKNELSFKLEKTQKFINLDISKNNLPYNDNEIDFIFIRHVLEDLEDPFTFLKEIQRISKNGYIETPSPIAEISRQVANPSAPFYRGYPHHYNIIWNNDNSLNILPKLPRIEYLLFDDLTLHSVLNQNRIYWNTYFIWNNNIKIKNHNLDFNASKQDYYNLILQSLDQSIKENNNLLTKLKKRDSE